MAENTIRIGLHNVRADDVAQVLGKTGTLLGRVIARLRLSYAMGHWVSRESLGESISQINQDDLTKVWQVFRASIGPAIKSGALFNYTPQIERIHNSTSFDKNAQDELRKLLIKQGLRSSAAGEIQALGFSFGGQNASVYLNQHGGCTIYISDHTKIALSDPSQSEDEKVHVYRGDQQLSDEEGSAVLTTYSPWFAAALEAVQKNPTPPA
jgi:hypothetical protein